MKRLVSPTVIGWPLLIGAFVVFAIDGFPFLGGADLTGSRLEQGGLVLQAAAIAQLPLAAVLFAGRFTWLRAGFSRRHPSVTVLTFFVATLVADAVFQAVLAAGSDDTYVAASLIDHVLYKTAALCLIAALLVDVDDYRNHVRSLERSRQQLTLARSQAAQAERAQHREVDEIISHTVVAARAALSTQNAQHASQTLRDLATGVVRPLGHSLATDTSSLDTPQVEAPPRPTRRAALRTMASAPLVAPRFMALFMMILGFRQTVEFEPQRPVTDTDTSIAVTFDATLFVESISVLAVVGGSTWLSARLVRGVLERRLDTLSPRQQGVATTIGVFTIAAVTLVVVGLSFTLPWFPEAPRLRWWTPLLTVVPLMVITFGHGLARSLSAHRRHVIDQLQRAVDDLRHDLASLNARLWYHRRQLAHDVHGRIQAELNAAAIQLQGLAQQSVPESQRQATLERLDTLLAQRATSASARTTSGSIDIATVVAETQALWRDVCTMVFASHPVALARLHADEATASAAAFIVVEACANAIVKGEATEVKIEIDTADDSSVWIRVVDNGVGTPSDTVPGLGSQFLNEVSLDWTLEPRAGDETPGGSVLGVRLAT